MNKDSSKYRLIFVISVLLICIVNVYLISAGPELSVITNNQPEANDTQNKTGQNLELKAEDFLSLSYGLKVETLVIASPVSFDTVDRQFSNPNHLISLYLKKKYSLSSHTKLIISNTLNLSPLITKLQI